MSNNGLLNNFDVLWNMNIIPKELPKYIKENLHQKFMIRPYQEEAFSRLTYFLENHRSTDKPNQILFQMATGSGKTLVMAGSILHLYKQGYRNFVFFVNSKNIIEKTRDNFLNDASLKYLFNKNKIEFDGKIVKLKEVSNFDESDSENINILFTTIQGLHLNLLIHKENQMTIEDFDDKKVVLISDEAHHINVLTKRRLTKAEEEEKISWEQTVNNILYANPENILLEFTATAELSHPAIAQKYLDKHLFDYGLKQFRQDKFSKEVSLLRSDLNTMDRVLQAILINQYKLKVAHDNKIPLKPVILFKSKTINESKEFEENFYSFIQNLNASTMSHLKNISTADVLQKAFNFFESKGITLDNLVEEIKSDFSENNCIIVNSADESEEKQITLNTLEEERNSYRAIFAVDKLNEGWDVLNLFDIVRLDETKGTKGKTVKEAQLIGRGARYFPFLTQNIDDEEVKDKRKFDNDSNNPLRVLETLHFHSVNNNQYIDDLTKALKENGLFDDEEKIEVELNLKKTFKDSEFYKLGGIYQNKKIKNDFKDVKDITSFDIKTIYTYAFHTGYSSEQIAFDIDESNNMTLDSIVISLNNFGEHLCRAALNKLPFYSFSNLKKYFPKLTSVTEFINDASYLGKIQVRIQGKGELISNLSQKEKLDVCMYVLQKISNTIQDNADEYIGTREFYRHDIKEVVKEKITLKFSKKANSSDAETGIPMWRSDKFRFDLQTRDWYVYSENYGSSEEKYFIRYLDENINILNEKYDDIYLIRNDNSMLKIYRFSDGKAFEPDFILFLSEKDNGNTKYYQIFVEPKGNHLLKTDEWKQEFLKEIEEQYEIELLYDSNDVRILGLPFYNEDNTRTNFHETFYEQLKLSDDE